MRKGMGKGQGKGYKNIAPMDSHIHSLSAKGQKYKKVKKWTPYGAKTFDVPVKKKKVKTLNMMSPSSIKQMEEDAERKAKANDIQPYEIRFKSQVNRMPPFPFPFIGQHVPDGWEKTDEFFVDSSGFGANDELALSVDQFKKKMKVGRAYAITSAGQFQVYIAEFKEV